MVSIVRSGHCDPGIGIFSWLRDSTLESGALNFDLGPKFRHSAELDPHGA
jgi:hypothetical protein